MGNFKNTKKIKFIMKWVIFATILIVLFSVLLFVIFLDKEEKLPPINDEYVDNGDEEDTSIVQEMHVVSNLKDEYYLNEDFDITDIEIFVKYKTQEGFVSKYLKLTSDFIDGYPEETELPNTSTLGEHSFTIIYLDGAVGVSYKVVEFSARHCLNEMLNLSFINQDSMFSKVNSNNKIYEDTNANNFVDKIYSNVIDNNGEYRTLSYANIVYNGLYSYFVRGNLNLFRNTNSSIEPIITENGNILSGKLWTDYDSSYHLVEFELTFDKTNNGLILNITTNGKTTKIIGNYSNKNFNMAIVGELENDVLINYSSNRYYIAEVATGNNDDLNTKTFDSSFASSGINVLECDLQNDTIKFNNITL